MRRRSAQERVSSHAPLTVSLGQVASGAAIRSIARFPSHQPQRSRSLTPSTGCARRDNSETDQVVGLDPKMHGEVRCSRTPSRPVLSSSWRWDVAFLASQGFGLMREKRCPGLYISFRSL